MIGVGWFCVGVAAAFVVGYFLGLWVMAGYQAKQELDGKDKRP